MTISQRVQEHEESLLSSAGNKPLSILYTYMHTRLYINNMVCPWLSSLLKLVISGFSKGEYEDDEVVSDAINDPMGFFGAAGKSTLQSPWQLPSPRCDSVALGSMWGHKTMIECIFPRIYRKPSIFLRKKWGFPVDFPLIQWSWHPMARPNDLPRLRSLTSLRSGDRWGLALVKVMGGAPCTMGDGQIMINQWAKQRCMGNMGKLTLQRWTTTT